MTNRLTWHTGHIQILDVTYKPQTHNKISSTNHKQTSGITYKSQTHIRYHIWPTNRYCVSHTNHNYVVCHVQRKKRYYVIVMHKDQHPTVRKRNGTPKIRAMSHTDYIVQFSPNCNETSQETFIYIEKDKWSKTLGKTINSFYMVWLSACFHDDQPY